MSGYATGEKKLSFLFPEDEELRKKWIYFVNRKNYNPGHNILELYNILVQIRFTISKKKLDT